MADDRSGFAPAAAGYAGGVGPTGSALDIFFMGAHNPLGIGWRMSMEEMHRAARASGAVETNDVQQMMNMMLNIGKTTLGENPTQAALDDLRERAQALSTGAVRLLHSPVGEAALNMLSAASPTAMKAINQVIAGPLFRRAMTDVYMQLPGSGFVPTAAKGAQADKFAAWLDTEVRKKGGFGFGAGDISRTAQAMAARGMLTRDNAASRVQGMLGAMSQVRAMTGVNDPHQLMSYLDAATGGAAVGMSGPQLQAFASQIRQSAYIAGIPPEMAMQSAAEAAAAGRAMGLGPMAGSAAGLQGLAFGAEMHRAAATAGSFYGRRSGEEYVSMAQQFQIRGAGAGAQMAMGGYLSAIREVAAAQGVSATGDIRQVAARLQGPGGARARQIVEMITTNPAAAYEAMSRGGLGAMRQSLEALGMGAGGAAMALQRSMGAEEEFNAAGLGASTPVLQAVQRRNALANMLAPSFGAGGQAGRMATAAVNALFSAPPDATASQKIESIVQNIERAMGRSLSGAERADMRMKAVGVMRSVDTEMTRRYGISLKDQQTMIQANRRMSQSRQVAAASSAAEVKALEQGAGRTLPERVMHDVATPDLEQAVDLTGSAPAAAVKEAMQRAEKLAIPAASGGIFVGGDKWQSRHAGKPGVFQGGEAWESKHTSDGTGSQVTVAEVRTYDGNSGAQKSESVAQGIDKNKG